MNMTEQLLHNQGKGRHHEAAVDDLPAPVDLAVRAFAFYLPQFHPIPQNDEWWGRGFTEWTNVTKALPQYEGHYQPRLPSDLGFYDLRLVDTLRAQAGMARRYGLAGFCFHWYWFAGERLLETPLRLLLDHQDIDLPFFVNWANENWTRRWDGLDAAVLMAQRYGSDDDIAVADAFLELTADRRYVRIDGRPIIMLYRPTAMPDAAATVARWRARFAEKGEADPYVLMAHAFDDLDPRAFGIDGAVQYAPHNPGGSVSWVNHDYALNKLSYGGKIFSYDALVDQMLQMPEPAFEFYRGVCPGWDNEARKPNKGFSFAEVTPRKYGRWLAEACRLTLQQKPPSKRIVFINAWNEWAEGAHLEPDRHHGHAFLRETLRALHAAGDPTSLGAFVAERDATAGPARRRTSAVRAFVTKAVRKIARKLDGS